MEYLKEKGVAKERDREVGEGHVPVHASRSCCLAHRLVNRLVPDPGLLHVPVTSLPAGFSHALWYPRHLLDLGFPANVLGSISSRHLRARPGGTGD